MTLAVNAAIVGERPTGLGLYGLSLMDALADNPDAVTAGVDCEMCGISVEVPASEARTLRDAMKAHLTLCPAAE